MFTLKQLKKRLQNNVDRQQTLSAEINRGKEAEEEYKNIEKDNKDLILRIIEMEKAKSQ